VSAIAISSVVIEGAVSMEGELGMLVAGRHVVAGIYVEEFLVML